MVKIKIDSFEIYYDLKDASINTCIKFIKQAIGYNKKFFESANPKFEIRLVYSRKEFDKLYRRKTENWTPAFAKKSKIVIFSLSVFEKKTCWKKKDFYSTLVHEINHIFFTNVAKKFYEPLWLSEGLATYLQHNKKKPRKKIRMSYKAFNEPFNYNPPKYNMYYQFVYYLIKKYGEKDIVKMIKLYGKNKNFDRSLQHIYKKTLTELIENANKN